MTLVGMLIFNSTLLMKRVEIFSMKDVNIGTIEWV
jgi:hypothetical protein